jgi:hypothetical protein
MQHACECPVVDPALKATMTRLVGRIAIREILPWRARPQDPQDPIQDVAGIAPRAAAAIAAHTRLRQQGRENCPLRVSQVHAVEYDGDRNFVSRPCSQGL